MSKKLLNKLSKHHLIAEFLKKETREQLIRYVISGLLAAGLDCLLVYIFQVYVFKSFGKIAIIYTKTVAYIIGFWFVFLINRYWSFKSNSNMGRQIKLFAILFIFNLGVQNGLIYLFVEICKIYLILANLFVIGIITTWNFFVYKKIIYK